MQTTSTHSPGIIPVSLSRFLERLAFYGMRSFITLYMVHQLLFEEGKASSVYGLFVGLCTFLPLLGGLLGDLVMSPRTTAVIGGFIQALGCFVLAVPSDISLYIGLLLIAIGTGLYSPNLISTLGGLYKTRTEKMDAAMVILYVCVNIGAMAGAFTVGFIGDRFGMNAGMLVSGLIMSASALVLLLSQSLIKESEKKANIYSAGENKSQSGLSILVLIATMLLVPLFWTTSEYSLSPVYARLSEIEQFFQPYFYVSSFLNPVTVILAGITLAVIYSYTKFSTVLKILIGFLIFLVSSIIMLFVYRFEISNSLIAFIFFAMFLQSVAEIFVSPLVLSVICKHGPAKFNSTLIAANSAVIGLISYVTSFLTSNLFRMDDQLNLLISICFTVFFVAVFLTLYLVSRGKEI